jgi:hypothetical protein
VKQNPKSEEDPRSDRVRVRRRDGKAFRVNIETNNRTAHDRLLRMWLCAVLASIAQRNPRAANWSRSFHRDCEAVVSGLN